MIPTSGSRSVDILFLISSVVESIWAREIKFCICVYLFEIFLKVRIPNMLRDYIRNRRRLFEVEKIGFLCYATRK
jgi:hypothetical protein